MTHVVEAIYSNGSFQPTEALDLPEQLRVRLIVQPVDEARPQDPEAAFQRLLAGIEQMGLRLRGPLPSRDELHDRI